MFLITPSNRQSVMLQMAATAVQATVHVADSGVGIACKAHCTKLGIAGIGNGTADGEVLNQSTSRYNSEEAVIVLLRSVGEILDGISLTIEVSLVHYIGITDFGSPATDRFCPLLPIHIDVGSQYGIKGQFSSVHPVCKSNQLCGGGNRNNLSEAGKNEA